MQLTGEITPVRGGGKARTAHAMPPAHAYLCACSLVLSGWEGASRCAPCTVHCAPCTMHRAPCPVLQPAACCLQPPHPTLPARALQGPRPCCRGNGAPPPSHSPTSSPPHPLHPTPLPPPPQLHTPATAGATRREQLRDTLSWDGMASLNCCNFGSCGETSRGGDRNAPWIGAQANQIRGTMGHQFPPGVCVRVVGSPLCAYVCVCDSV